ncbi:hypothetical protein VB735_33810 [Halotia wernerae UHCC 0503]|nr:hypothetical protein [Halotia wernerae UHCC 0503]
MSKFQVGVARFSVGDRLQSKWDKNATCTLIKIREGGKKPYTIQYENGRKVHCDESWLDGMKFLEEITPCNLHNLTSAQELVQDSLQRKGDNCHTIKDDKHHKIELCQRTEDQKLQKNTGNCINKDLAVKMSVKPSELEGTLCGKSSKIMATTLEQKNCFHLLNLKENDTPQTMKGITDVQNAIATSSYIESSGNYKMELSQTVITSTIKTDLTGDNLATKPVV